MNAPNNSPWAELNKMSAPTRFCVVCVLGLVAILTTPFQIMRDWWSGKKEERPTEQEKGPLSK